MLRWFGKSELLGDLLGRLLRHLLGDLACHGSAVSGDVAGVLVGEKGATVSVGALMFALAFFWGVRLPGGAGGGERLRLSFGGSRPLNGSPGRKGRVCFRGRLRGYARALGNDEVLGRLDPLAASVDFGEILDGAKDAFGSGVHAFGAFDGTSQGEAQVGVANGKEVESVGVAINGAQRHLVVFGDVARALPMDKFLFDFVAKVVGADGAVGFVSEP